MDDELDEICALSDGELVTLAEGGRADAAEVALSELRVRRHPQTGAIARRLVREAADPWLRGSALVTLMQLREADAWAILDEAVDGAPPQVLTRIVEELATTDDVGVFEHPSTIARVRARLSELSDHERYLVELFRNRFQ